VLDSLVGLAERQQPLAPPLTWPGDGSMTIGLPEKSRTCVQADGTIIDCLLDCGKDQARQRARRIARVKVLDSAPGGWERLFR
jgi:hypothetical protein